jgi:hypothetical protein
VAKTDRGQPQGLTLEKLRLQFEDNIFFAAPGRGWFKWGPTWARCKTYTSVGEFQLELGIDVNSRAIDPAFGDILQRDFRIPKETMALVKENYPRGPVPGVVLGTQD